VNLPKKKISSLVKKTEEKEKKKKERIQVGANKIEGSVQFAKRTS